MQPQGRYRYATGLRSDPVWESREVLDWEEDADRFRYDRDERRAEGPRRYDPRAEFSRPGAEPTLPREIGGYPMPGGYGRQEGEGGERRSEGGYGRDDWERDEYASRGADLEDPGWAERRGYGVGARPTGPHAGKGPRGYARSDERIREDVMDALTRDPHVDASDLEVTVEHGEVTLSGNASDRREKRLAEVCAERVAGVKDVHNRIRVGVPSEAREPAEPSGSR